MRMTPVAVGERSSAACRRRGVKKRSAPNAKLPKKATPHADE
jgi:hypothetical protein